MELVDLEVHVVEQIGFDVEFARVHFDACNVLDRRRPVLHGQQHMSVPE